MSDLPAKTNQAKTVFDSSLETACKNLEARAAALQQHIPQPDQGILARLREERDLLVKRINGHTQTDFSAKAKAFWADVALIEGAKEAVAPYNTDALVKFVKSVKKNRLKRIFHQRTAAFAKGPSNIGDAYDSLSSGLGRKYSEDDVIIHVIERKNISKPHGDLVAMRVDGTIIQKMGAYKTYGSTHNVIVKVNVKDLKGLVKKGAVATVATAKLMNKLNDSMTNEREPRPVVTAQSLMMNES